MNYMVHVGKSFIKTNEFCLCFLFLINNYPQTICILYVEMVKIFIVLEFYNNYNNYINSFSLVTHH